MDWVSPPPPLNSASNYESKINPSILLIILILAVIFFISGILHLLVRLLLRPRASEAEDSGDGTALQGQLQELFHLHDAGVDQSFIDTLPVFLYSAIVGLKDPFDCAVCLSGFEAEDKLRLLPSCSHAFHVECIDTWLFSHSTCPLCRRSLFESGSQSSKDFLASDEKFVSVELGKFRGAGEGSSSGDGNLEDGGRRCFSMGSFDYVMEQSCGLQVSFASIKKKKQESLSVSKIWLQPRRPSCSSSRRAFSFRLPLRGVLGEEATTDRIDLGEECGSEVDLDVEVGSCDNRFCSQIEEKTPSFARRTLMRIVGRQGRGENNQ